tara:strand:+ start:230 stop:433 length:204 start_codon:yes stop_codon:yes gene_type:complete
LILEKKKRKLSLKSLANGAQLLEAFGLVLISLPLFASITYTCLTKILDSTRKQASFAFPWNWLNELR